MKVSATQMGMWKRLVLLLGMLPYLFASAFGEALHSHPLAVPLANLQWAASFDNDAAPAHEAHSAADGAVSEAAHEHHSCIKSHLHSFSRHATAQDCLACLWSAQSLAPLATSSSVAFFTSGRLNFVSAASSYVFALHQKQRSRAPPLG
jgi:hypothetical protein